MNYFALIFTVALCLKSTGALTSLADCPAGYFCALGRSITPQACPPGSFSLQGASRCTGCPAGYYQIESGKSFCDQCPPGLFVDFYFQIVNEYEAEC